MPQSQKFTTAKIEWQLHPGQFPSMKTIPDLSSELRRAFQLGSAAFVASFKHVCIRGFSDLRPWECCRFLASLSWAAWLTRRWSEIQTLVVKGVWLVPSSLTGRCGCGCVCVCAELDVFSRLDGVTGWFVCCICFAGSCVCFGVWMYVNRDCSSCISKWVSCSSGCEVHVRRRTCTLSLGMMR